MAKKIIDLRFLFWVVAVLEFFYFLASMMPPRFVEPATGWVLSSDGHWITKLMGVALLTQASIAWMFRNDPEIRVAKALAFYQVASATVDWTIWIIMAEDGIFNNSLAQSTVLAAIISHYMVGILLIIGIYSHLNKMGSSLKV